MGACLTPYPARVKIVLGLLGVGALAALSFGLWVLRPPTTQLVDASGGRLTAGEVPDAAEPGAPRTPGTHDEPGPFDEPRRLLAAGRYADAREHLVGLLETSERDGEACILLSEAARRLGEADESADWGLKAVELLPESAAAHLAHARGMGLQMLSGDRLAALGILPRWKAELRRTIELDPRDIEARSDLAFFHMYMPALIGGDLDRAIELAREIEPIDPVRGGQLLAMALHRSGETERAIETCRSVLEKAPGERALRNTLASFYADEERLEEADEAYEAARRGPRDEHYYRSLYMQAQMWIEAGEREEEALAHLDEFIRAEPRGDLMPTVAHAWWRKGVALEALGRIEEARAAYEASLRLDPGWSQARRALEALPEHPGGE